MRQAVVVVGGKGTRLGALAKDTPKPLLPIEGDVRFLDLLIDNIARHGFEEILLLAGHLGEQVEARYDGARRRGARLAVLREPRPAGTAGALVLARERLAPVFLMTNGDSFFDINYLALAEALEGGLAGALALRRVDDAARYGRVETEAGRVTAFHEKDASHHGAALISGGVYALRKDIADRAAAVMRDGRDACSIESDIFPVLAAERVLAARTFDGYFLDIGLPESLDQGRAELPRATRRPALLVKADALAASDAAIRAANDAGWFAFAFAAADGANVGRLAASGARLDAWLAPADPAEAIDAASADWRIDASRVVVLSQPRAAADAVEAIDTLGRPFS